MSRETVNEPARDIPVRDRVQVVVCGGGVSGIAAALAAAEAGASVWLIERHGCLGGTMTAAQVNGVGGWQYDLDGSPLIAGLPLRIMERIVTCGGGDVAAVRRLQEPRPDGPDYRDGGLGCYWIQTNPEAAKHALDGLLAEAGVRLLLHARAVRPILDGRRLRGVFVESASGREAILADCVVDCSGDADIAVQAGAGFDIGRPEDGACQPMSLIFTVAGCDPGRLWYGAPEDDPETDPLRRNRYHGAVAAARARGDLRHNPNDLFCAATPITTRHPTIRAVNFTRIQGRLGCDADDLTAAEIEGRAQVAEAQAFIRSAMPGCAQAAVIGTALQIGIREGRRIHGDATLSGADVRGGRHVADAIARGIYLLDIHNPTEIGTPSRLELLDQPYSIPYRCLLPRGLDGILVAGRSISGDHEALASYRIQSHCLATGQAAGTAAALAALQGCTPRSLDVASLRRHLIAAGANVGNCCDGIASTLS